MTNDNIFFNKYQKYKKKYFMYKNKKIMKGGGVVNRCNPINFSQVPTPIRFICNSKSKRNTKVIIRSHGNLSGDTFTIPKGINIITLTPIDNVISLDKWLDDTILQFYLQGGHIFEDYDCTMIKTPEGKLLEDKIKLNLPLDIIQIKNHVGGNCESNIVNDMELNFTDGMPTCSMNCITYEPKPDTWGDFMPSITSSSLERCNKQEHTIEIKNICLSNLIKLTLGIDDFTEENTYNITFIVIACRRIPKDLEDYKKELIRVTTLEPKTIPET